jgi:hypothetical protein
VKLASYSAFLQTLGTELAGSGVRLTALCPGPTNTAFVVRHGMQDVRMFRKTMEPARVAQIGYCALRRGRPVVVAGVGNQLRVRAFLLVALFADSTLPAAQMAIGATLTDHGARVDVRQMKTVADLRAYGAVVAGSAIRGTIWLPKAMQFMETHQAAWRKSPLPRSWSASR